MVKIRHFTCISRNNTFFSQFALRFSYEKHVHTFSINSSSLTMLPQAIFKTPMFKIKLLLKGHWMKTSWIRYDFKYFFELTCFYYFFFLLYYIKSGLYVFRKYTNARYAVCINIYRHFFINEFINYLIMQVIYILLIQLANLNNTVVLEKPA